MSSDAFDGQILAEKLSKLNNSQQSIESLSRWCISHRKKARQIVDTWEKSLNSRQRDQRVAFLYLSNDILQNSRRKGSEFVNEFWKVLPAVLKQVFDNGDEPGKKAVARLVDIWEERNVFGSRGQGLKDALLGKNSPLLASNEKGSSTIKKVKKDDNSVRIKLAVGSLPEKIITAFQTVFDEHHNEDDALCTCTDVATHVGKIKEEAENATPGYQQGFSVENELLEQENVLRQCIDKLERAEAARSMLVLELKEALNEQELKLEMVQSQLHVARNHIEQMRGLRMRLTSVVGSSTATDIPVSEAIRTESNNPPFQPSSTPSQPPLMQPMVSFAPLKITDEESKKAAAAAVVAKLAASTSSAQMFTSVLSSLVAEEAASMNSSLNTGGFHSLPHFPSEKRQKVVNTVTTSDVGNSDAGKAAYFTPLQQQTGTAIPLVPPSTSLPSISQSGQMQPTFDALPPLPPPPPVNLAYPAASQYMQSAGMMTGVMPYGFGANTLPPPPPPPPPPLPPHMVIGMTRPGSQTQQSLPQQTQPQQQQQQQQAAAASGYYRPPGIGFYGQNHQSAPPPVHRQ